MNKIYRLVFSKAHGTLVAVAEVVTAQGKGSRGGRDGQVVSGGGASVWAAPLSMLMLAWVVPVWAGGLPQLPQNGQVVGGQATITTPAGNRMVITQGSQRTAIDWQSFNIGAGNSVRFIQPSSTAQALNRVIGLQGSTQILGTLTANGQVYIVNPQGVVFGKGSVVNVGSLLATTRDINPNTFMQQGSKLLLSGGSNGSGLVQNDGNLSTNAPGGWIVLAADAVKNTGTISTPGGTTALLGGGNATLALSDGLLVNVGLSGSQVRSSVDNAGAIHAPGGKVLISTATANDLLGSAINLSGVVDVSGERAGNIVVDAGPNGVANVSGAQLDAVGTSGVGGNVTITGQKVGLFNHSTVNVSGQSGGGTVLAGGGFQGQGGLLRADTTMMDGTSTINADATGKGNGGTVGLWSNGYTQFNGNISAQGGPQGGDGGRVDTSSQGQLGVQGQVTARAAHGANGLWSLDPTDITVSSAADSNYDPSFTPTGDPVTVNNASLGNALQGGTNVSLNASLGSGGSGSVNVEAPVTSSGNGSLSLLAANGQNVTIGANISLGSGSLTAVGGDNTTVGGTGGSVIVNSGAAIAGSDITLRGGVGATAPVAGRLGNGSNGGTGGAVVVDGSLSATGTVVLQGGGGGGGGGGGYGGSATAGGLLTSAGGVGGTGGAVSVSGNVTAAGLTIAGGTGGGGGGGGAFSGAINGFGGTGGNGGSGGAVVINGSLTTTGAQQIAGGAVDVHAELTH